MPRQKEVEEEEEEGLVLGSRKRGCSPSSSSSSVLHNYRFKRAILVGKAARGSKSSTPAPSWGTKAADSPKFTALIGGRTSGPISARKLAATLWEMNQVPSPTEKREMKGRERLGSLPPHLSDPSHSPVSERSERSGSVSHHKRNSTVSHRLRAADKSSDILDSLSSVSLMESYQTFQQRYLINDTYWGGAKSNAPIFVYTGNEGKIDWFAQNTGFMFETAPRFKALLVFIEHRFYGKSVPYGGDKSVAYKNASSLGYLSSTQALADYATLIIDLKTNFSAQNSPVVVFGGSYGGMLAAWFRLKYPHVAIGALASSSPILNFENITSPYTFNNIITRDFRSESENCYKVIKGSWKQIEATASQPGGLEILRKSFKICKNYISRNSLESWLETAYVYTAMTDYPTPSNFLSPMPPYPVKEMCKAIDNSRLGDNTFAKLYGAAQIYYNYSGDAKCFNLIDNSDPHDLGGWSWQACTEMIMPTDGNNKESIFPESEWSYEVRAEECTNYYKVPPRPNWITSEFGGNDIRRVLKQFGSNIIFFNGLRDPWSGAGVLKSISKTIVAIVAKKGAHHVDLRFSTSEDPEWLTDVRRREVSIISKWLSEYYYTL